MTLGVTVWDYVADGGCPQCGGCDATFSTDDRAWYVCSSHAVRWACRHRHVGARSPNASQWLARFKAVDPKYPPATERRRTSVCVEELG